MKLPGFVSQFKNDLAVIPSHIKEQVNKVNGLSDRDLLNLLIDPHDDRVVAPSVPIDTVVKYYHDNIDEYTEIGSKAIENGEVAYCIIADGIDSISGSAKSLLKIPNLEMSLITLKMFQATGTGPIVILSTKDINEDHKAHLSAQMGVDMSRITFIDQFQSYSLSPDYSFILDEAKQPSLCSCGPGDIFQLLADHPVTKQVKYVMVVDVSNIFASLDPTIIGHHIYLNCKVSCEVTRRKDHEPGSVLVLAADGLQISDISRIDVENIDDYSWLCTDSYVMNSDISFSQLGKQWYRQQKKIKGTVQVQHNRLLEEITTAYDTAYVCVDRSERFMPVRDLEDLNTVKMLVNINAV
jgi:UDP-N-acetylglucosamine pyrophosphorylase